MEYYYHHLPARRRDTSKQRRDSTPAMDACLLYRGVLPPGLSVPSRVRRQRRVFIARCGLERTTCQRLAPSRSEGFRPEQQIFSVWVRQQSPNLFPEVHGNARAWCTSSTGVSFTLLALMSCVAGCFVLIRRRMSAIFRAVPKRVVILGGGFAGITLARELAHKCAVTLIDIRDFFRVRARCPWGDSWK